MSKIIVADDDFSQRDLYVDLFKSAGFEVRAANDGQDAWEKIQKEKPDLVFTGILMPRMTGFQLIEKMRNDSGTATMPVIIFSHLGRDEDRKKAMRMTDVTFMVKGYDGPMKILQTAKDLISPAIAHAQFDPNEDPRPPGVMV